jgi:carotenoid cleavage dioxygenase-like enzyme
MAINDEHASSYTTHPVPSHLRRIDAPVPNEITAVDLSVTGTLPPELAGRYFRNGPNPPPASTRATASSARG